MPADVQFIPIPGDSSHVRKRTVMASVTERDQHAKVLPMHLPANYRYRYQWVDEMTLEEWVEPEKPTLALDLGKVDDVALAAAMVRENRRTELEAMKDPDLLTLAAERGVAVDAKMKKQRSLLVAAVIEAEGKK